MKRKDELQHEVEKITDRIAHLIAQAHKVEKGTDEWAAKTRDGEEVERTDYHKINHSEAVSYWREVRENEERRDAMIAKLQDLDSAGGGEPATLSVQCERAAECPLATRGMSRQ